jgi:hypothetical protein
MVGFLVPVCRLGDFGDEGVEGRPEVGHGQAHVVGYCLPRQAQDLGHLLIGETLLPDQTEHLLSFGWKLGDGFGGDALELGPMDVLIGGSGGGGGRPLSVSSVPALGLTDLVEAGIPDDGEEEGPKGSFGLQAPSAGPETDESLLHHVFRFRSSR